ncbi:hypothetical protein HD806DRAFT_484182 [Xylariaceae sp. AK1471]|nr:hypothetical protein HD806DRAFT_484182 [Xylariaceae sp. AK1471]
MMFSILIAVALSLFTLGTAYPTLNHVNTLIAINVGAPARAVTKTNPTQLDELAPFKIVSGAGKNATSDIIFAQGATTTTVHTAPAPRPIIIVEGRLLSSYPMYNTLLR